MSWFKVDDVLTFHPRVLEAGNAAIGLWVRAGTWSMAQLTDGFIPTAIARQLGSATEIRRLVTSGLWNIAPGGYQFHAWAEDGTGTPRQLTREQVEERRRADRERKAARAQAAAEARWKRDGIPPDSEKIPAGIQAEAERNPDGIPPDSARLPMPPGQARPGQASSSNEELFSPPPRRRKREPQIPIPDDWHPNPKHAETARKQRVNLDVQAERFRNHALAVDRRAARWDHAFTNWLLKATPDVRAVNGPSPEDAWYNR